MQFLSELRCKGTMRMEVKARKKVRHRFLSVFTLYIKRLLWLKESMMEISADGEVCTEVERTMATVKAKRVKKQE